VYPGDIFGIIFSYLSASMKSIIKKYKEAWSKDFVLSALTGVLLFLISIVVNDLAVRYAALRAGNPVPDILLDNLPVINTDIIFSEGAYLFALCVAIYFICNPKTLPFAIKGISLFIIIRSLFVMMTHFGPYPGGIATDFGTHSYLTSGTDLFFSGHTGMPFLMALMFWNHKSLRALFIVCSVVAAAAVILGHLHYTIDVASAYFITYGIYRFTKKLFPRDIERFLQGLGHEKLI
jgi:hypothetical protein